MAEAAVRASRTPVDKRALGPQNYWRPVMAQLEGDVLCVEGFAALPGLDAPSLSARINGVPADVELVAVQPWFTNVAGYLEPEERVGFKARARVEPGSTWTEIQLLTPGRPARDDSPLLPAYIYLGDKSRLVVPADESIQRVSGKLANRNTYINEGYTEYRRLLWILARHPPAVQRPKTLDWGCGCGRVTRHLIDDESLGAVVGIDIDAENVAWCAAHLDGTFHAVSTDPPTPLEGASFDLIVSSSVLSHLTWAQARAWLAELHRLSGPTARLVLSFHGTTSTILHRSHDEQLLERSLRSGFDSHERSPDLDGHVADVEYYRNTFMTDERAAALFDERFERLATYRSVLSGSQDAAVLAPR